MIPEPGVVVYLNGVHLGKDISAELHLSIFGEMVGKKRSKFIDKKL